MQYASVRILSLPSSVDKNYEYHIPLHLEGKVSAGNIVLVPFGGANKVQPALCESVSDNKLCTREVKPILAVPGKEFSLNSELLSLCKYMRDTLLCSTGDVAKCMLPSGITVFRTVYYSVNTEDVPGKPEKVADPVVNSVFEYIKQSVRVSKEELSGKFGPATRNCIKKLIANLWRATETMSCIIDISY